MYFVLYDIHPLSYNVCSSPPLSQQACAHYRMSLSGFLLIHLIQSLFFVLCCVMSYCFFSACIQLVAYCNVIFWCSHFFLICFHILVLCLYVCIHNLVCSLCLVLHLLHNVCTNLSLGFDIWSLRHCSADIGVVFMCLAVLSLPCPFSLFVSCRVCHCCIDTVVCDCPMYPWPTIFSLDSYCRPYGYQGMLFGSITVLKYLVLHLTYYSDHHHN